MSQPPLRPPARAFVAALVACAVVALAVALLGPTGALPIRWPLLLFLAGATTLAWLFPLDFAFRTKVYLDTAATIAALLLLPPGAAMLVAGVGTLLAHLLRPASRDAAQAIFNTALAVLQTGLGAALLTATDRFPTAGQPPAWPSTLLLLVVATAAMHLLNVLAVATVVALQSQTPVRRAWLPALREDAAAEAVAHLSLLAVGVVAALLAATEPWALILLAAPVAGTFLTLRHHVRLRNQAEAARLGSDAGLAEAQRIARLGSWEWEPVSDHQRWSDQTFRLFGLEPRSVLPSPQTLVAHVHPDDRPRFELALRRAAEAGQPFGVEHRLLAADGAERVVHHRGEVVTAPHRPIRVVGTIHDITERKALEGLLAHRAFHDPLTDLPNRALFADRLAQALAAETPPPHRVAVLFLDLDGFKLVNDSLGHAAGDDLLVAVGDRLRRCLPDPDAMVARLGGDEYALLLPAVADPAAATRFAEQLIAALRPPVFLHGQEAFVGASVGVAVATPGRLDPGTLLRSADIALYEAKAAGRGTAVLFHPAMQRGVLTRLQRETALRRAVERGELLLHYQPEFDLASGRLVGVEALVRWAHPELGLLPPAEFIRLAEETGLIVPLGSWVLREACRQGRAWQDTIPHVPPVVSVNLSARQLRDPALETEIARTLAETGFDPRRLELEITESVATTAAAETRRPLLALRRLGVRIAIDDFGTGYSSLGRLLDLAPDALKIDRAFVAGLGHDPGSRAVVRSVATLARELAITVTAEGVEHPEQLTLLRDLGVVRGQGFYLASPAPAAALAPLLAAHPAAPGGLPDPLHSAPLSPVEPSPSAVT